MIHSEQIRVFTPFWIIVYILITPFLSFKYTADFLFAFVNDKLSENFVDPGNNFESHIEFVSGYGFWLWACFFYPVFWALFVVCSVLFRTGMLFYQTCLCCKFRSKFSGDY